METIKKHRIAYIVLALVILGLAAWGFTQYRQIRNLKIRVENNYNRAFHELVDYVDDIDTLLQKSMLVSSPAQLSTISSELFRETSAAKACLGQLPISEIQLENTEKFLSQIGDFTYVLSQNVIYDEQISEEDYQNLESLGEYAKSLNKNLTDMQADVYNGTINFGTIAEKGVKHLTNTAEAASSDLSGFETVEQEFQEYPALIYDGPFSEHIENAKPALLEHEQELSAEEAKNLAQLFLGEKGNNLTENGASENSNMDFYSFRSSDENHEITISMTKKGGHVLYYLDNRATGPEQLNFDQAIQQARQFLNAHGYTNLKESYYEKTNGVATINFAYEQGGVICYSDLIKVKVALDDGEILGLEAKGYIMNHKQRELNTPAITEQEAKAVINKHLAVEDGKLALIPKVSLREVLCYEFTGNYNGSNFIIYINAENAREEKILMLIESEDGILTV